MLKNTDDRESAKLDPSPTFPKNVLEQAAVAAKIRASSYLSKRLDLRGKTILSFSESANAPSECAISLARNVDSAWQLGVHICDVSEYVCEGSPMDIEAGKRHAAVHNGFSTVNMLPDTIVNDVCNLDNGCDRLALSVLLDIDARGNLVSTTFEESVIRVAEKCIFTEIDQLGLAKEASSVLTLREKYSPLLGILMDTYELAALFCNRRRERGGLDCTVFRKIYKRDGDGRIVSFDSEPEPDSRAMIREICYFASQAIGEYMSEKKLPCIYIGQSAIGKETTDYLCELTGCAPEADTAENITARIADAAKGSAHYELVCEAISAALPCAEFSTEPIFNTLCGTDRLVSFIRPATRYPDLLTQRMLKTSIAAGGNISNINLTRYKQIVSDAAVMANKSEKYSYEARHGFYNRSANEYIKNSEKSVFVGFPLYRNENGRITVLLNCGAKAEIPAEYANELKFENGALPYFEIISIGDDNEPTLLKPIN